jgi:heme oxygenase
MQRMVSGSKLTVGLYLRYLHCLQPYYHVLEREIERAQRYPNSHFADFPLEQLRRAPLLRQDLDLLSAQDSTPRCVLDTMRDHVVSLVTAELEEHSQTSVLLAHAYCRYMGDFFGGQILRKRLSQHLSLGDEFFAAQHFADVQSLVRTIRGLIDSLPEEQHQTFVDQVAQCFAFNQRLFDVVLSFDDARCCASGSSLCLCGRAS